MPPLLQLIVSHFIRCLCCLVARESHFKLWVGFRPKNETIQTGKCVTNDETPILWDRLRKTGKKTKEWKLKIDFGNAWIEFDQNPNSWNTQSVSFVFPKY